MPNQQIMILHGDNLVASRDRLNQLVAQAKTAGQTITHLEGQKLTTASTEQLMGESSLFGGDQLLVIEELHSLPLGKKRDALVAQVAASPHSLIIWEKKKLTALMLKKFGSQAKAELFETHKNVWKLMSALSSEAASKKKLLDLYHQTLEQEDPFYLLTLFVRQIRLLIQIQSVTPPQLAPFQLSGLRSQVKNFTLKKLLAAHHQLLEIEYGQKSGQSNFPLDQELFLFLYNLSS